MSHQSELFERAAKCERLMNVMDEARDMRKEAFKHLRDMWIALANESPMMSADSLAKEIAAIEVIQSTFDPSRGASAKLANDL